MDVILVIPYTLGHHGTLKLAPTFVRRMSKDFYGRN